MDARCERDEHDVDTSQAPHVCRRCGQAICAGCGRSFDLMCNNCDEDYATDSPGPATEEGNG